MEKFTLIVLIFAATFLSGCKLADKGMQIETVAIKFALEHDDSGEGYRLAEELAGSTINIYEKAIDLVDANNRVVRSMAWKELTENGGMKTFVNLERGHSFAYVEGEHAATWTENSKVKYSFKLK